VEERLRAAVLDRFGGEILEASLMPPDSPHRFLDDACLNRYLRANEGSFDDAYKQLIATVEWRAKMRPWEPCELCMSGPCGGMSHNMRHIGYDANGAAVIFTSFGQAHDRKDKEMGMRHLTWVLESTAANMEERFARTGSASESWVWVVDYEGFGMVDMSPQAMQLAARLLCHYPERLAKVYMMEAPYMFGGLWKMVTPLLKQTTRDKVEFASLSDLRTAKLSDAFGAELAHWLATEMEENRVDDKKQYWEWYSKEGHRKAHDPRGAPSLLAAPEYCPPFDTSNPERCYSCGMEATDMAA